MGNLPELNPSFQGEEAIVLWKLVDSREKREKARNTGAESLVSEHLTLQVSISSSATNKPRTGVQHAMRHSTLDKGMSIT